jgi:hypothetical protein
MAAFSCFQDATCSELQQGIENEKIACILPFKAVLTAHRVFRKKVI